MAASLARLQGITPEALAVMGNYRLCLAIMPAGWPTQI